MQTFLKNDTINNFAKNLRILTLRMVYKGGASHIASIFSCIDILSVLYFHKMNFSKKNYNSDIRDKFILSKGHAGAAIYAVMALLKIIPQKDLNKYYKNGSLFSGHVSHYKVPGIEYSTGSLGSGIGVASGIALAGKLNNQKSQIFTLLGDGELNEGSVWESLLFANHHKLDNLTIIIDRNYYQSILTTEKTLKLNPLREKFEAFGLDVFEIDGHDVKQIKNSLNKKTKSTKVIIANTIKGKGVSFMENDIKWHYKNPNTEEYTLALKELTNK
tara:strand:- start:889 stop:1707 length:819 start_codon:yes stop_codon:yes gene_type:complete